MDVDEVGALQTEREKLSRLSGSRGWFVALGRHLEKQARGAAAANLLVPPSSMVPESYFAPKWMAVY